MTQRPGRPPWRGPRDAAGPGSIATDAEITRYEVTADVCLALLVAGTVAGTVAAIAGRRPAPGTGGWSAVPACGCQAVTRAVLRSTRTAATADVTSPAATATQMPAVPTVCPRTSTRGILMATSVPTDSR